MTHPIAPRINVLLFGLSEDLATDLTVPLQAVCSVRRAPADTDVSSSAAQVIFCGSDSKVVRTLKAARPDASVVVVSRYPEVIDWLDAMEAGASDYCAAPFESASIRWVLDSSLRSQHSRQ